MDSVFQALVHSDRVGAATRETLDARASAEAPPRLLGAGDFATLDAVTRRLVPQPSDVEFVDVAGGIDRVLGQGAGDGWRYADLPPDREAFESGLKAIDRRARNLHGVAFAALGPTEQDDALRGFAGGAVTPAGLNVKRWFEDLLAAATEIYVSHPATLARIGFSGIAFRPRWEFIGLGATQPWEPAAR